MGNVQWTSTAVRSRFAIADRCDPGRDRWQRVYGMVDDDGCLQSRYFPYPGGIVHRFDGNGVRADFRGTF